MMKFPVYLICFATIFSFLSCKNEDGFVVKFNSEYEVSGKKFALRDINPDLPENWDDYNYVVIEFMITTPQRFNIGFNTSNGYNELRIMSYTPNGWNRLAIPLRFYRELPGAWHDLAGMYNQPRYTGWINLGEGKRGVLQGIDSIGIRMRMPIGNPEFHLRSVTLAVDDPGDVYLGDIPVVDEFGQWNLGSWEGKIFSLEQLLSEWQTEDQKASESDIYGYSTYGGYLSARIDKGTGFFRTALIDGRWWFVDPEGYLFLSHGINCVSPGGGGNAVRIDQRSNIYKMLPPEGVGFNPERPNNASFGNWNLYRRYGEGYREQSINNIFSRMERWGVNTIANWSSPEVMLKNRKPFMLQLGGLGMEGSMMGLADVYDPGFALKIDEAVKRSTAPYVGNPWLIGYFTGNEPSWQGIELRVCDLILNQEANKPIRKELEKFLASGDSPERRKQFIYASFRIFIEAVDAAVKRHSPGHLNLGIRFGGVPQPQLLEVCRGVFDVFSFNSYTLAPSHDLMEQLTLHTGMPLLIGEFHFGTVDRGMAQSLWQVDTQEERGTAYRYYTEKAFSHPALIGTSYFQWADQDLSGRGYDGENYNCGLIDVTDRPYGHLVNAISETSLRLYDVHKGNIEPFNQVVSRARGYDQIPDLWNK
jgi:hypothetical protein